jgi:hypothetical protein
MFRILPDNQSAPTMSVALRRASQVSAVNSNDRWAWGVSLIMGSYTIICAVGSFLSV